jgi:hypothetical protein
MGYGTGDYYHDQEQARGISRELLIAIGAGALLLIGAVIVLGVLLLRAFGQQETAEPPRQPSYDVPTAREAYVHAVQQIREYDLGAQLASGAGAWTPVIDPVYLDAGRTGWTFHFYLPASHEMATVIVDRGGSTRVAEVQPWETPPSLLDDQGWQVDSSQAIGAFLDSCQAALDQPDVQVQMRLSTAAENQRLMWQAGAVTRENQSVCEVRVDATTGQVR